MKVLVCGSRSYADRIHVFRVLTDLHSSHPISVIVHGGATGADTLAHEWAVEHSIAYARYPANWDLDGRKAAGPIRNQRMLDAESPDLVVAFLGGRGTQDMMRRARKAGIEVRQV